MNETRMKNEVKRLLIEWFFHKYWSVAERHSGTIMRGFLTCPVSFGTYTVPMHIANLIPFFDSTLKLKEFLDSSVVLAKNRYLENMSRISTVLKEWNNVCQKLQNISYKDVEYYLGPGMLLDKQLKPLIMASCSVVVYKRKGTIHWYRHSPTLNIAPEMLSDSAWKKLILNHFIPLCSQPIKVKDFCSTVPDCYKGMQQTINVQIHDLSQFMVTVQTPELTEDLTKELGEEMLYLSELPSLI